MQLGLTVSPRAVWRYVLKTNTPPGGRLTQSWATFLRNHANAILACDFRVVVSATFQRMNRFVLFDICTRRIVHWNVTAHPTAEWTVQQSWNGLSPDAAYRFVVHCRDAIFAPAIDAALASMLIELVAALHARRRRTRIANGSSAPPA